VKRSELYATLAMIVCAPHMSTYFALGLTFSYFILMIASMLSEARQK
jgi:hypothetical protein